MPGAKTQWNGLSYWQEFWTGRTVAKITPQEQRAFRQWLTKRGVGEGGIDRVLSTGRAALNRAHKWQELSEVPHIFGTLTAKAKRARAPMGHPITPLELARLFDAARSKHMLIHLLIASTLARPGAILDLAREPDCVTAFVDELDLARGANIALDRAIDNVKTCLRPSRINEATMRHVVEVMALALQGSMLVRHAPPAVADAFCAINLGDNPGFAYGATEANIDTDAILARAKPQI